MLVCCYPADDKYGGKSRKICALCATVGSFFTLSFFKESARGATDNMHGQIRKISLLFRMSRLILGLGRRRLQ
jgi:hypothetical protein